MNLATNAVALKAGQPIAVLERSGQVLRVFEPTQLHQALEALRKAYSKQRIFSGTKYLTIKKYPPEAADALKQAGFQASMLDFILYRS